jgi:serine/threonine protein kinase
LTSERWRQIEELYHSAREHGRSALDGADPEVQAAVEKLLEQDSASGSKLLDQRVIDLMSGLEETPATTGSRLGPYRIEATLGFGGMGKVFRATDTRLNRQVAIKICKDGLSDRFEQESRSIAAINHPNVCTLYDVGPNYLVMELIEGETLAARLKRGKLPFDQTIRIGAQVAEALAVAHAKGIVHRDLKPGNIMLAKSGAKVLDFGLARSTQDPLLTAPGKVIGTPAYMAPERLECKEADARTDIYTLGLVLSEMATGRRSQSPDDLPPALRRVVKRCLETDPDDRWQSARDLKWELESIPLVPAVPSSRFRSAKLAAALAFIVALPLVALAVVYFRRQLPSPPIAQLSVWLPAKARILSLAVSPDGSAIAMVLVKDGVQQIWIRPLDSPNATPLAGTENASNPFWSPDSRSIAFFADAQLKKIDRSGGPVQMVCDALGTLGGTWNRKGDILLGSLWRVQRVSDAGGPISDLPGHAVTQTYPAFLPDGRHFLATRNNWADPSQDGLWLNSMTSPVMRRILPDVSNADIVDPPAGSNIGAVLFTRAGTLMALPFDMKRRMATGDPFPVAQNVATQSSRYWLASASTHGVLAYVVGQPRSWQYDWRDEQGKILSSFGHAGGVVAISPDGKQLVGDPNGNVTVLNFKNGTTTQVAFRPHGGSNPIWSPHGHWIAYYCGTGICRKRADGAGTEQLLIRTNNLAVPKSWSPDGKYIIYAQINAATQADLFALPVEPAVANPHPLVLADSAGNEDQGQFSPDGHWVAYTSNESGLSQIYVIPFPPAPNAGKWLVSRSGGVMPRWAKNGKKLFYISPDWKMMEVNVATSPVFQSGPPHPLFDTHMVDTGIRTGPLSWDIAPDGKRFLIITDNGTDTSALNVIMNWRPAQQK